MEMLYKKQITILSLLIAVWGAAAAATGIFSTGGPGEFVITTVRGETVRIYGEGLYQHMSSDVAIQGIAQDYITLFGAVPLLLVSLYFARKGSVKGRLVMSGVLFYFLLTYLFYLTMAMYNPFFLGYVVLLSTSFFACILSILSFDMKRIVSLVNPKMPVKWLGGFLIINSVLIALMWLSVVIPSLLSGVVPVDLDHYTTLIVQGLDLALFLPLSFFSGYLLMRRKVFGYICAPAYLVFLSLLMTALSAKIIGMTLVGVNAFPAIVIIPVINVITLLFTVIAYKHIGEKPENKIAPIHLEKNMA